ncbi:ArsR family transcriptional regulator [Nonomuraea sp. NPDC049309]|uniref:ArsR family transcriptional regulator n=1 Tax=Nonomuraea sp. NPDC049309 TaxID=3364350 RepID=UPI0037107F1D
MAADLARRVSVLADPIRLRPISILLAHEQGRVSVYDLANALEPTEPEISHHLEVLLDAGLVDCQKTGVYSVTNLGAELFRHLVQLFGHPPRDEP